MFRKISIPIIIIVTLGFTLITFFSHDSSAVTADQWTAGNIIDDVLFTDKNAMSVDQIQAFLNSKVPVCDSYGTSNVSYWYNPSDGSLAYETGSSWVTTTRAIYGQRYSAYKGNTNGDIPYTCLKDYYEVPKTEPGPGIPANNFGGKAIPTGARSAAQLIWDAAQKYNISPKVLLVKLGTESAGPLTSDDWPFVNQYTYAMGAHCPDSGPGGSANCDPDYAGFSIQISEAASLLRWYLDSMSQPWWSYRKPYQVNSILWNIEESGCGRADVFIENKATAALYTYTPYQPNQAALNNMYGTGDGCSAYGNRNFWRTYFDWFGDPRLAIVTPMVESYNVNTWLGKPLINKVCTLIGSGCYQLFENGAIYWTAETGAQVVHGGIKDKWVKSGFENGTLGYPTSGELAASDGGVYQKFQGGTIYWSAKAGAVRFNTVLYDAWTKIGASLGFMGKPITDSLCSIKNNGCYQLFEKRSLYWTAETGAQYVHGGIKDKWVKSGFENGPLGYPTSGEIPSGNGVYQTFQGGTIYWSVNAGAVKFTSDLYNTWKTYGAETGFFGKPATDTLCGLKNNGCYQLFARGAIYWTAETGAQVVHGGIKDKWVKSGFENGTLGYPTSGEIPSENGVYQTFQGGTINWTPASGASIVYN